MLQGFMVLQLQDPDEQDDAITAFQQTYKSSAAVNFQHQARQDTVAGHANSHCGFALTCCTVQAFYLCRCIDLHAVHQTSIAVSPLVHLERCRQSGRHLLLSRLSVQARAKSTISCVRYNGAVRIVTHQRQLRHIR